MVPPVLTISLPSGPSFDMILVEGGEFHLPNRTNSVYKVRLSDFYIGKYQVTQALWNAVMGQGHSYRFVGDNIPADSLSWMDAQDFTDNLNQILKMNFRLPTEVEWEFAACGGKYSQGYIYAGSDMLKQVGWYRDNSNGETKETGLLLSNELGIYDMSGNVWEWCSDWYSSKDFFDEWVGEGIINNPKGPSTGSSRVCRGGSYYDNSTKCLLTHRNGSSPSHRGADFGLRLAMTP